MQHKALYIRYISIKILEVYMLALTFDTSENQILFTKLYDLHSKVMLRCAYGLLNDMGEAEDAVQEAFMALSRNASLIDEADSSRTRGLVLVITRHKAYDILRKRRPSEELRDELRADTELVDMADLMIEAEVRSIALREIGALDHIYRNVLYCRYALDLSPKETAKLLGCKGATVRSRLKRGEAILVNRIKKELGI